MMTNYRVIVEGSDETVSHEFDGEPQINLTFENDGKVYKITSRAHDEHADEPTVHAVLI
jgi:hypothetical protein